MDIRNKIIPFSPIFWLILFGVLFFCYHSYLNISGVDSSYLEDLAKSGEFLWRISWGILSISTVLISFISIFISTSIIHSNTTFLSPRKQHLFYAVLSICIGFIVLIFQKGMGGSAVTFFITDAEQVISSCEHPQPIKAIVDRTMMLSASAVFLISIASCSILIHNQDMTIEKIKHKYQQFKMSFYVTSIFLGIGILQVYLLFTWARYAIISLNLPETNSDALFKMVQALTISGSIIYTLVFMTFFIPVSIILNGQLKQLGNINVNSNLNYIDWKKSIGLYNTPWGNVKSILILLSPTILGIVTTIFNYSI